MDTTIQAVRDEQARYYYEKAEDLRADFQHLPDNDDRRWALHYLRVAGIFASECARKGCYPQDAI